MLFTSPNPLSKAVIDIGLLNNYPAMSSDVVAGRSSAVASKHMSKSSRHHCPLADIVG
jgi:hypothetical protein